MDPISAYAQLTQEIVNFTGMSRPMLHMHAGMAIYLASQFMLGTRRGSPLAISMVLYAELFNELMNYLHKSRLDWPDTLNDIALTLFWPAMCYIVSRYRRWRWSRAEQHSLVQKELLLALH